MCAQYNFEARSRNHCYCEKAVSIVHYKCLFVALVIQHAIRTHRIILPFVACPTFPNFSALPRNGRIFVERLLNVKCVCFSVQFLSETFLTLRTFKPHTAMYSHTLPHTATHTPMNSHTQT
jgi:hypothetical protein